MSDATTEADHEARMRALKEEMRTKTRAAAEKRGLLAVHTGNGKGKSTAAFGMLARCVSHKYPSAVVQFIKSGDDAVERVLRGPYLKWHHVGDGFTWETQNRAADIASCRAGWEIVRGYLRDPQLRFLLLDEINVVLSYDYLPLDEVLSDIAARHEGLHVVCTGRGAPEALIAAADLGTEMREIKHPFNAGVKAQPGIEF